MGVMMLRDLHIERWPIERLRPSGVNPRTHSPAQVEQIAASIEHFGFCNPILIAEDGEIVAGEGRYRAAQARGLAEVPVIVLGHLTDIQRRALAIADNQLAINAGWDERRLREQLAALRDQDFDLNILGFADHELARQLALLDAGARDEDQLPAPAFQVTRLGDLWLLQPSKGRSHRILCGDATSAEDVSRLLAGQPIPILLVADPPYGVSLTPEWREEAGLNPRTRQGGKVANDDRCDWAATWELFPGDVIYVWHAGIYAPVVARGLVSCGFEIRSQIIWVKQHFAISRGSYHWQHEPCWYAVRHGEPAHWRGDRKQSTVWDVPNLSPFGGEATAENEPLGYGTQKPVELMRRPIRNHTRFRESVYDPFLGSGTTLIAAESIGRVCFGLDINTACIDMTVLRWQRFTGREAVLDGDRRTFDEIGHVRQKGAA